MKLNDSQLLREANYINGEWVIAADGATFDVTNPATGELIAKVPSLGAEQLRDVIASAETAWVIWRAYSAKERSILLRKWFELIVQHQDDLALIMTTEQGKPLVEARGEVLYAASFIEWYAEEAKRVYGDVMSHPLRGKRIMVIRQPIGVTAAITPWNFPAAMITRKCGPALAAGCPMIVKPAEQTPLTALALAELSARAGIPKGVFSVITGEPAVIGPELTSSPTIRKLSFTGSTAVGKLLMAQCASTVKKMSLELGGNAPFIVFNDADLEAAVQGAMLSKYRNSGQTCVCANRFLVQSGIYDQFAEKLASEAGKLRVGQGTESDVQQGPLIDVPALTKVESHVADALNKGARLVLGGARHALGGTFYQPTVLTDVTQEMLVAEDETFGPVAPLIKFETEAEALAIANNTRSGLAAYLYSRDMARIWRVSEGLEYGMVGVNEGILSNEVAPFGGVKESGLGREGSRYGIEEYLEMKYICMGGIDS